MGIYSVLTLVPGLLTLLVGQHIYLRAPAERLNRIFAVACALVGCWGVMEFGCGQAHGAEEAIRWCRAEGAVWPFITASVLHFSYAFTHPSAARIPRRTLLLFYLPAVVVAATDALTGLISPGVRRAAWGWAFTDADTPVFLAVEAWIFATGLVSAGFCASYWRQAKGARKSQAFYVMIGVVLPSFFAMADDLRVAAGSEMPRLATLSFLLALLAIGHAVRRFQLFSLSPATAAETILETMSDALILVGSDRRVLRVNPAASRLLGSPAPDLIGQPCASLFAPTDGADGHCELPLGTRPLVDLEAVLRPRSSAPVPVSLSSAPVSLPDGSPRGFVLVVRDLTERKQAEAALHVAYEKLEERVRERTAELSAEVQERRRAEEALRETTERLDALFNASPVAVIVLDPEGCVRMWSPAAERTFGWSRDDVVGTPLPLLSPPGEAGAARWVARTAQGEVVEGLEFTATRRDGTTLAATWSAAPLRSAEGSVAGVVALVADVTEQHRLEEQIRQAQRMESLGVLAGGIAHDFNNLLAVIMGRVGLALLNLDANAPEREHLEQVDLASRRASELTEQMLTYAGKARLEIGPVRLDLLVGEMAQLLASAISKKAVLSCGFATYLPVVQGDPVQIRQVVMNLITNASDALGDGAGRITLRTHSVLADRAYLDDNTLHEELPEGQYVVLSVSDTGCGMDAETQSRMFEPFFTTKFAGRGLGLSAVLGIVRGHHGALRVRSQPGKGTTFEVLLPAADGAAREPAHSTAARGIAGEGTVLVVDDDAAVRTMACAALRSHGFAVLAAATGDGAIELFRQRSRQIAVVLLDFAMPDRNGDEVLRALRETDPGVRVILSSGYSELDLGRRLDHCRPSAFLHKPYTPAALAAKVSQVMALPQALPQPDGR